MQSALEPRRKAIIFVFGAFGPLAAIAACILSLVPSVGLRAVTFEWPMLIYLYAYLFGIVPALVTGITYAFVPRNWRRIVLSPIYGGVISALFGLIFGFREVLWLGAAAILGAAAALVCAICVRLLKADVRSVATSA